MKTVESRYKVKTNTKRSADGRLEYRYTEGQRYAPVKVRLDGKHCGEIRPVEGGWQYFPKGQRIGGDVLPTISAVQRSLEAV